MKSIIRCQQLCKSYKRGREQIEVLHAIDLDITEGEFVALMGPSGSGKTTLLNLIGAIDTPTSGELHVDGLALHRLRGRALAQWRAASVGFVFQFYNLLGVLTAQQNVELPLLLTKLGRRERKQRVQTALGIVGLSDRTKHKPSELSGGQQQRVAIARAIVADPKILVCDEPTGDLDRNSADEILALLQSLSTSLGKTILMVTHDHHAAQVAQRCLHMDKGTLTAPPEVVQS